VSSDDRDFGYKLLGKRLAWALGHVPMLNVPVWLPELISNRAGMELTDADVLGFRFDPSGKVSKILIDCKSTTKGRAVDRVLWVRGLGQFLAIDDLYLFQARIPQNARWLADQLAVRCLDQDDLSRMERHLGLDALKGPYFDGTGYEQLHAILNNFPKASEYRVLARFLLGGVWTIPLTRRVPTLLSLGEQSELRQKLRADILPHRVLVLQGALVLALNLGLLAARLNIVDALDLEQRLREELHGGAESLEQKRRYLAAIARLTTESRRDDVDVDLPNFPQLLEQVNRLLMRRYVLNDAIRDIDLALHYIASRHSTLPRNIGGARHSLSGKVASDILSLFVSSNGLSPEFGSIIMSLLPETTPSEGAETVSSRGIPGPEQLPLVAESKE
jgi:hypothetical protein